MASQMEWSPDFCLSCDRQLAEGGAYCSQACRLAEMEKAGKAQPPQTPSQLSSSASSTNSANGFYLPPAVNFSAYKSPSPSKGFDMGHSTYYNAYYYPTNTGQQQQQQHHQHQHHHHHQQQRSLTPSSSRSSLASTASQAAPGISAQAASQLNNYVRSFDQVREYRRRLA